MGKQDPHLMSKQTLRVLPTVICLMIFCSLVGCIERSTSVPPKNVFQNQFPEKFEDLTDTSKQKVREYALAWWKVFSVLGVSGFKNIKPELLTLEYEKGILPRLQSLESGSELDKAAFRSGDKIREAMFYVSDRLKKKSEFDNPELNSLLRCGAGDEMNQEKISKGISAMILDYIRLIDGPIVDLSSAMARLKEKINPESERLDSK